MDLRRQEWSCACETTSVETTQYLYHTCVALESLGTFAGLDVPDLEGLDESPGYEQVAHEPAELAEGSLAASPSV